jgi:hypothetical protein
VIRTRKTLWLLAVLFVATGLAPVSAAVAAEGAFELEAGATELTASSGITVGTGHLFQMAGQSFACNNVSLALDVPPGTRATALETSSSTYNYIPFGLDRCVGALGFERKLTMNGCQYRFDVGETSKAGEAIGTIDVVCPPGAEIVTQGGSFCTIDIPPQSGLAPVIYRNVEEAGLPGSIAVEIAVADIRYRPTGFCGGGERTDGRYSGFLTFGAMDGIEVKPLAVG